MINIYLTLEIILKDLIGQLIKKRYIYTWISSFNYTWISTKEIFKQCSQGSLSNKFYDGCEKFYFECLLINQLAILIFPNFRVDMNILQSNS